MLLYDSSTLEQETVTCLDDPASSLGLYPAVAHEAASLVIRLLQDTRSTLELCQDLHDLVRRISALVISQDVELLNAKLRALKVYSSSLGLGALVQRCVELLSWVSRTEQLPPPTEIFYLEQRWSEIIAQTQHYLLSSPLGDLEASTLCDLLNELRQEELQSRFSLMSKQCAALALQMALPAPEITICCDEPTSVDSLRWGPLWAAVGQLLKNAIEHGLEPGQAREAQGKPAQGTLLIKSWRDGEQLIIEVTDDGAGIDLDAIAAVASRKGLFCEDASALREALFTDGVTTKAAAHGRGLGGALNAILTMGGQLSFVTHHHQGTHWRIAIPAAHHIDIAHSSQLAA